MNPGYDIPCPSKRFYYCLTTIMITDTLFVFGPGGTGKRSLNYLLKDYVVRIHPHVLRNSGPRGTNDIRYANPGLYDDIYSLFRIFGTVGRHLPADEEVWWYSRPGTLCYKVRGEYHILFLHIPYLYEAKVEIYAPVIPVILKNIPTKKYLGRVNIIILNPADDLDHIDELKDLTRGNCSSRGDSEESINEVLASVDEEIESWRHMIDEFGAVVYNNWKFPEYLFTGVNRTELLKEARNCLLDRNPQLEIFLKPENKLGR